MGEDMPIEQSSNIHYTSSMEGVPTNSAQSQSKDQSKVEAVSQKMSKCMQKIANVGKSVKNFFSKVIPVKHPMAYSPTKSTDGPPIGKMAAGVKAEGQRRSEQIKDIHVTFAEATAAEAKTAEHPDKAPAAEYSKKELKDAENIIREGLPKFLEMKDEKAFSLGERVASLLDFYPGMKEKFEKEDKALLEQFFKKFNPMMELNSSSESESSELNPLIDSFEEIDSFEKTRECPFSST